MTTDEDFASLFFSFYIWLLEEGTTDSKFAQLYEANISKTAET